MLRVRHAYKTQKMILIVPMANMRPLINVTSGRDIWQQGEREECHVADCVRDSQSYLGFNP
jgi:hypothetical protein